MNKSKKVKARYLKHVYFCPRCRLGKVCDTKKAIARELELLGEKIPYIGEGYQ